MRPVSVAIIDAGGRLEDWNGGFEREFDAVGDLLRRGAEFAQLAAAAAGREGFARDGARALPDDGHATFEYVRDGFTVRVESIRTSSGGRLRIAADHITADAIDTGRIAHDLNNMLMSVLANADSIAATLAPDAPATRYTEAIMRAVDRGRVLTGELRGVVAEPTARAGAANAVRPGHAPAVLLVEDNALVRETLTASLRALGYRVAAADCGEAARKILDGGEPVDVLFTDVMLPGGLGGADLARLARTRHPRIKTLFTSGFDAGVLRNESGLPADAAFLMKPFDLDDLVAAFAALLGP